MDLLKWFITEWSMDPDGGWRLQPVIVIERQAPFLADNPASYIDKLMSMHNDPSLARGTFYTYIGQLRDGLEQIWKESKK